MSEQHQREEFSNQSYMNPQPDRPKYQGRDVEIGRREAQRRLDILLLLEQRSLELSEELGFARPMLLPKGSASVNMCAPNSDFDVAVVVQSGHIFTQKPELWRQYQEALTRMEAGFKIEPRLVVESPFETRDRVLDLISARNKKDMFTQKMLAMFKELLPDNK